MVDVKKIRTQLFIALGSLAVLLVGIGGMGLFSTSQTNNGLQTVYEGRTVPLMGMAEVNDKWQIIRLNAVIAANSRDAAVAKTKTVESAKLYQEIEQIWSDYSASEMTAEESALYKTYNKQAAEYEHTRQRTMRMAGGGDFEGAIKNGRNDATNKFRLLHDTLFELVALQGAVAGEEFSTAQNNFHTVMAITLLTMILGLVLVVYFTRRLLGAIIDPLDELNVRAAITDRTCIVSDANLKGEILSVNDKYVEISQYSRDELIGQPHSITRHPDMAKATFKKVWSTIGRGGIFQGKIKNRAKDGTPYYVDAVISPVLGANGKPRKYIGVRYDIAAAEIERQNMEGIFSAINSSFGYIELDINGNVLTANQNFLQLMEYQLDEIVGKHHRMFVDPAFSSSAEYTQFWDDLKAGKASADTFQRITKSGKGVWIQATYSPIKDEMGRVIKVAKIATDVTKEKLEVLGQLDAIGKAQAMIEFSIDGVILNANTNFLDMFGYTQNEVSGQNYSFLLDPANRNAAEYRDIWEKLRRGEFDAGQYKYAAKDGRTLWIQTFHSALLDLSNKPFKVVMYATEITQQINASQMLELAVVQTKEVIAAAKEGDLEQRVSMEGKTGEIAELCSSVNSLLETTDVVMSEVGHVLSALAKGDLNEKVTKSYQGAFGKLSTDVNLTAEKLQEIVGSIAQSANIISVTSGEIASGNGDLSERTEKQAANREETAASIEQLTSTVKQNADNAQQANQLAIGASDVAEKGGQVVSQVVETMSSINDSSKKIVDIISVIDGIAFQTNILALNAAVEAARAGEQGRGFAVVATEVRNLAQRSAAAAKEIKTLIGDSVNKVEDGTKLVDEAGDTMNEIVQSIKNVTDIMGEITAASREQSIGIKQVNDAITQVDEVTQQNAALVEQSAAAAEEMQNQAKRLTQAISVFNLRAAATKNNATDHKPERRSVETRPFSGSPSPGRPVSSEEVEPRVQPAKARASSAGREDDWSEF